MKLEQSFTVAAPVDQVWAALIDVERVAPCLPGAEITGADEDGAYHGTFTVKLGPTTAAYNGTLRLDEVDEAAHTVVMSARGTDKRGQGGATATIRSVVAPEGDGTKVDVDTDFTITGRLARFGRGGMIEDVSRRLLGDFSSCLQQRIVAEAPPAAPAPEAGVPEAAAAAPATPPPPAPAAKPVNGLKLFFQVLADRIRRLFKRSR
jgi:carbon monoxide dehydrogenase subunit G